MEVSASVLLYRYTLGCIVLWRRGVWHCRLPSLLLKSMQLGQCPFHPVEDIKEMYS